MPQTHRRKIRTPGASICAIPESIIRSGDRGPVIGALRAQIERLEARVDYLEDRSLAQKQRIDELTSDWMQEEKIA